MEEKNIDPDNINPQILALIDKAIAFEQAGLDQDAIDCCEMILNLDNNNEVALSILDKIYYKSHSEQRVETRPIEVTVHRTSIDEPQREKNTEVGLIGRFVLLGLCIFFLIAVFYAIGTMDLFWHVSWLSSAIICFLIMGISEFREQSSKTLILPDEHKFPQSEINSYARDAAIYIGLIILMFIYSTVLTIVYHHGIFFLIPLIFFGAFLMVYHKIKSDIHAGGLVNLRDNCVSFTFKNFKFSKKTFLITIGIIFAVGIIILYVIVFDIILT